MRALTVRVDQTHPEAARLPGSYEAARRGILELDSWAAVQADPEHVLNVLVQHTHRAEAEGWPPAVVLMTVISLWHSKRHLGKARNYLHFVGCLRNHAEQTLVAFGLKPEEVLGERR